MLRKDPALSRTLRSTVRAKRAGTFFQREDEVRQGGNLPARHDVQDFRGEVRFQGTGCLHHAAGGARIRKRRRGARITGRTPEGQGGFVHDGGQLRRQDGYERHDAHHRFSRLDRSPDACLWSDQQARGGLAGVRCSRRPVPRRDREARNQD